MKHSAPLLFIAAFLLSLPTTTHSFIIQAPFDRRSDIMILKEAWKGDVVPGDGRIRGCSITSVSDTEWTMTIDGSQADLGQFSQAIYKKLCQDAPRNFQGFRPGTIPPHVEPTYRAFAMDEVARETVLEAMQQNNIRPFENCRAEMVLENFCIPPVVKKGKKKRKKKREEDALQEESAKPEWRTFDTMKEAIAAGWKPGQSFSFIAKGVRGQQLKGEAETDGTTPLGLTF